VASLVEVDEMLGDVSLGGLLDKQWERGQIHFLEVLLVSANSHLSIYRDFIFP